MFDLNESLKEWKVRLRQGGVFLEGDLTELEDHLREEKAKLENSGLTEEEAFLLAARRVGRADLLAEEYEKVNIKTVWSNRLQWMAVGVLAYLLVANFYAALYSGVVTVLSFVGIRGYWVGAVSFDLTLGLLIGLGYLLYRKFANPAFVGQLRGWMENRRGRIGLISVVIVYSLALPAISTFFATSTIQLVTAEDYSKVLRVWSWAFLAQSVILPALLAFWILRGAAQERFGRG